MPKTIEQRWKDVGVDRKEVANELYREEHGRASWGGPMPQIKAICLRQADALLPLIEKAVREGRISEHKQNCTHHCKLVMVGMDDYRCPRLTQLEAGE